MTLGERGQEGACFLSLGWAFCPTLCLCHSGQRPEGHLGHFLLSFFEKVPLPLFFTLTSYYKNFTIQKSQKNILQ